MNVYKFYLLIVFGFVSPVFSADLPETEKSCVQVFQEYSSQVRDIFETELARKDELIVAQDKLIALLDAKISSLERANQSLYERLPTDTEDITQVAVGVYGHPLPTDKFGIELPDPDQDSLDK